MVWNLRDSSSGTNSAQLSTIVSFNDPTKIWKIIEDNFLFFVRPLFDPEPWLFLLLWKPDDILGHSQNSNVKSPSFNCLDTCKRMMIFYVSFIALLCVFTVLGSSIQYRHTYAVRETHPIPSSWHYTGPAQRDKNLTLHIGLRQNNPQELERRLIEGFHCYHPPKYHF